LRWITSRSKYLPMTVAGFGAFGGQVFPCAMRPAFASPHEKLIALAVAPRRACTILPFAGANALRDFRRNREEHTMKITRRETLGLGLAGIASIGLTTIMPYAALAQSGGGDSYDTDGGKITIHPIAHASFVMTTPSMVIYNDPVGEASAYSAHPAPDLILITHEHGDHYNADTLGALVGENTRLVTNPAVFDKLPEGLKAKATAIANGESTTVDGMEIEAIPAYNTTEDRLKYHPKGRDNGYVLLIDGRRVYIAGDTEDIPEMRALEGIFIAFVPMNLPFTMDVDQAASAVAEFQPAFVYPYHYRDSDPKAFADKVAAASSETEVVMGPWYG
jgi:L-ascorbate metabolism protein UlaG (beta-lactamase superfamily)